VHGWGRIMSLRLIAGAGVAAVAGCAQAPPSAVPLVAAPAPVPVPAPPLSAPVAPAKLPVPVRAAPRAPPAAPTSRSTTPSPKPPKPVPPPLPPLPKSTAPAPAPALDLAGLEQRLKDTRAIGIFTKLSLKNQVDDLLGRFRDFHSKKGSTTLPELRQRYDLLLLKVLSVLQDADPGLASAISASREALWAILADPQKFSKL
jgi:hypothetical protein